MTEDEMVGWHHQLNGHEFEQTPGNSEEQGNVACCSSWGHKESDRTWQLNSNEWLGFSAFTAGVWIQSLVGELRFCSQNCCPSSLTLTVTRQSFVSECMIGDLLVVSWLGFGTFTLWLQFNPINYEIP